MSNNSLNIAETFVSIQGESSYAGRLTFFIRLAGCNLKCKYCDTLFALNTDNSEEIQLDRIIELAKKSNVKLVEITGGEPLAQQNTIKLAQMLIDENFEVMIETNGSYSIEELPTQVIKILDCKLPSSGEFEANLYSNYKFLNKTDEVKFVISDFDDYIFAIKIIDEYELNKLVDNLLFSPVLGAIEPRELVELMVKDNSSARLQLQLHKFIWDNDKRGV